MSESRPYYFVASHKVLDRKTINDVYVPRAVSCLNKYDVEILAVNQSTEIIDGQTGHDRLVILRFPSRNEAMRWYNSEEYQSMVHLRLNSVEGTLVLAEGLSAEDLAAAGVKTPSVSASAGNGNAVSDGPSSSAVSVQGNAADSFRSGVLTTAGFDRWSDEIKQEFVTNKYDGAIGNEFVFENDSVRV